VSPCAFTRATMPLREPIGERKGMRWRLRARGDALGVEHEGVRRGHLIALVTLCLRALP
jgi:hypothetical protein